MAKPLLTALAIFVAGGLSRAEAGMVLLVESDRHAYLVNKSDRSVRISGYQLSASMPVFDPTRWISIEDQVVSDSSTVVALLGDKAANFSEAAPQETVLTELALLSYGVWQPGQQVAIGRPFRSDSPIPSGVAFEYLDVTEGFDRWQVVSGIVEDSQSASVPEPSAFAMAAVGCAFLAVVRNRFAN